MAPKGSPAEHAPRQTQLAGLELRKGEIIGLLVIGTSHRQIAADLGLPRSGLWRFIKKHREEIQDAIDRRARRLEDHIIANQVDRIAELQWWYDKTKAEVAEHGITVEEVEVVSSPSKTDDKTTTISTREYRATLVKEARGILRDAAEELGQIKQPAKQEISTHQTYVLQLVRNDHSDIPQLG